MCIQYKITATNAILPSTPAQAKGTYHTQQEQVQEVFNMTASNFSPHLTDAFLCKFHMNNIPAFNSGLTRSRPTPNVHLCVRMKTANKQATPLKYLSVHLNYLQNCY